MHVLVTGSTGMIGQLIVALALKDLRVTKITALVRSPTGLTHSKYHEYVLNDPLQLGDLDELLLDIDCVYYCLGVYTGQVDRKTFHTITVGYPKALAQKLVELGNQPRFLLLSGSGADRTESSKMMFAKDKGEIENFLSSKLNEFYTFRPGYIYPVVPRNEPNIWYRIYRWLYPLLIHLGPKYSTTSDELANAMFITGQQGSKQSIFENSDIVTAGKLIRHN